MKTIISKGEPFIYAFFRKNFSYTYFTLRTNFSKKFYNSSLVKQADRYAKKLTTVQLIQLIITAQLHQHKGLRDISNQLNDDNFQTLLDLESISPAQLSRRLRDLPTEIPEILFQEVLRKYSTNMGYKAFRKGSGRIYLIDASTIGMCLSQYRWAEFRKSKSGIKLHQRVILCDDGVIPDQAIITPAKPADKTQMDNLIVDTEGALNVFDRGHLDYNKFDSYCENNIRFVTRLKKNALIEVIEKVESKSKNHIEENIVYLGKKNSTKMRNPLRLIKTRDTKGKPVIIVTNDFDLSTEEISLIYRKRWQIELFFKWIKQHFTVKKFYGLSEQAVINQLLLALITYCMLKIFKMKIAFKEKLFDLYRLLRTCLYDNISDFLKKIFRPKRPSKGRRRLKYKTIYQITERQVMSGDLDQFYSLEYDPLFL